MEKSSFRGSDKRSSEHLRLWEKFRPGDSSLGISKAAVLLSVPRGFLGNTAKRESRTQSEARERAACLPAVLFMC